jgi:hypothetical protein
VYHPYISQALTAERIADWLRTAEARRRPGIGTEPAPARRHRRARRAHPAARVPGQQVSLGTVAGRLGSDRSDGASLDLVALAASRALSNQGTGDRHDDESGAAALCQTHS